MEEQDYKRKAESSILHDSEMKGSYVARIEGHTYMPSELRRRGKSIE